MKKLILLSFVLLSVQSIAQDDTWTPAHQMKFKAIQGTAISPDGSLVAYVVREPIMTEDKSEYLSQIWVAAADGSWNEQYTMGEKSSRSPAFSPDGKQLAFLSSRAGKKNQVWVMRIRGGEAQQISDASNGISSFQWSPTGDKIAYTMSAGETAEEKKSKKDKTDVILVDQNYKYSHLFTVSMTKVDGERKTTQITAGDYSVGAFDFSPDGKMIAFDHQPDPRINTTRSVGKDISIVSADSSAIRAVVKRKGSDSNPHFSPDGMQLAFRTESGDNEPIGLGDLAMVEIKDGTIKDLPHTPDRSAGILDFTPDGKYILVGEAYHTTRQVLAVPTSSKAGKFTGGTELSPDNPVVFVTNVQGAIGDTAYNPATGSLSGTFQDSDHPEEVYISQVGAFALNQKLSNVNGDVAKPMMGSTELLTWHSKDGMAMEGLLTYPVGYEKGKAYPLILQIHGGPAGVYSQTFTGNPGIYMIQSFAQEGYAVLRVNPRGSTGYGKEFRYANFMDWGFGDYQDLMTGVDKVIDMKVADPMELYVMGWSYGGYMTSWVVTATDRFKAASMGAGLPNLISMTTTTDISDYLVGHMGGEFWDDYETYEKHSAMYHIKNVKTPTQVIHGANDLRVPIAQGQEFYKALQRLGVDTEMVVYPRTPHGPREPKFVQDVSERILKWFAAY